MPRAVKWFFAADLFLALMHLIGPPVPEWAARAGNQDYLWGLSIEANIPTWYASVQLALIGGLLLVFAAVRPVPGRAPTWVAGASGVGFFFFSLDEQISIHENLGGLLEDLVGDRSGTAFEVTGPWALVAAPLFLGALALAAYLGRSLWQGRPRVWVLYLVGAALFTVSFAGLELLRNFIVARGHLVLVEETGEMLGATLMLWGTIELLRSHGVRLIKDSGAAASATEARGR
jgi:hypothetical protein